MQNEVAKQNIKHNVKKAIACEDGLLLPEETSDFTLAAVDEIQDRRHKVDRQRDGAERRLSFNNKIRSAMSMRGWTVHVDQACLHRDTSLPRHIAIQRLRKLLVINCQVQLFVRSDPANPGQRTLWVATLTGALIVVPEFVSSHGKSGACVAFAPAAIAQRRVFWMSAAFSGAHPRIAALVQEAVGLASSQWKQVHTDDEFAAAAERGGFGKIALVTLAEKSSARFSGMKMSSQSIHSFPGGPKLESVTAEARLGTADFDIDDYLATLPTA